ncbi:MAG: glycosyltransferase [Anaerolineae bacterium]|nr:glycosyltransferase [Anaerolineales bacterium]MCQ3977891.1 glycosyl transferase family 1 [Anaerolineae bacterium]
MRILLLTPQRPYPPHQGTTLRNFNLVKELAKRHSVCVLTFLEPDQTSHDPGPLLDLCEWLETAPVPRRSPALRLRQMLTTSRPDMSLRLWSPEMNARLAAILRQQSFDVVEIEGIEMAPYLPTLEAAQPRPLIIYDAHNAEWILQKRACLADLKNPARWLAAAYSWVQWQRLRRYEAELLHRVDHTIAMSHPDKVALRDVASDVPITVVPNGVDLTAYDEVSQTFSYDLLFTGKMDFRPNIDAVLWFGRQVLPLIQAQRPGTTFAIVGQRPHPRLEVLRDLPGVTITGYVDDVRPYLAGASVYVAPLRVGGGTRLKLLEAMIMGVPIVSTTVGAEGFPVVHGQELILADEPEQFAQEVLTLLANPAHRAKLGTAGRIFAQANYGWDTLIPQLEKVYHDRRPLATDR